MRGQFADQYARKLAYQFNEGPFAFLVRDALLLRDQMGANHDFLGIPEIVEDICLCYEMMFGYCLRARFSEATKPCIVKFKSRAPRPDALAAALMYVHRKAKGQELERSCNTSYSGEGVAVPPHDIRSGRMARSGGLTSGEPRELAFATMGFSFDDEPTVHSQDELAVAAPSGRLAQSRFSSSAAFLTPTPRSVPPDYS